MEDDLQFLATTYSPHCRICLDKRLDGYYTLQYMESGGVELAFDDVFQRLEGSYFWPAYPGPRIRFHCAPGYDSWFHRHIGFRGPRVQRWIASGLWPWGAQRGLPDRDYPARFDRLVALSARNDRWGRLQAINLLEQLLLELAEERTQGQPTTEWLDSVMEAVAQQRQFVPDYRQVANRLQIGESTLRRRFKQMTGITLHEYVMQARMTRARQLLTDTDLSLAEIAQTLHYETVYFFTRQFKQRFGVPPGLFRRTRQR